MEFTTDKGKLLQELKKHKLCDWFWSEQIEEELNKDIVLEYEPVGDMGIYSKYFEFKELYCGNKKELLGSVAIINIAITANIPHYDIKKAVEGTDCFHNVTIKIAKEKINILTCHFRLWCGEEEDYSGEKSIIQNILKEN